MSVRGLKGVCVIVDEASLWGDRTVPICSCSYEALTFLKLIQEWKKVLQVALLA